MMAATSILSRKGSKRPAALALLPDVELPFARLHEACGGARHRFALWLAAQVQGPVLWIAPAWARDRLGPMGISRLVAPGRLVFVAAERPEDVLWCMEETLRSGAVALAIADLPGPPGLTQVRRMHLAAETGAESGTGQAPLGLLLTPENGGAQGIETRWHLAPDHAEEPGHWQLRRLRARTAPPAAWRLSQVTQTQRPRIESHIAVFPD